VSDYQYTPQILKKSGVNQGKNKENKSLSGERRVAGSTSIQNILKSQKEKIESLKTERYSQKKKSSNKKKIEEPISTMRKFDQYVRGTPQMRSTSRNAPQSNVYSMETTPYRMNNNTTQR